MPRIDIAKAAQMGYTPEQVQQYASQNGITVYDSRGTQTAQPQSQGGGLAKTLLPIGGSILGGLAGLPFGPAGVLFGGAAGGGLGSAFSGGNAGDIAKEAIFGAIGGPLSGGVKGAARVAGKLTTKELPKRLMNTVFKESIKDTKSGIAKGASLGEEALSRGSFGTTKGIYDASVKQIDNTENTLQEILMNSPKTVSIQEIKKTVQPLIDKYKQSGNPVAQSLENRIAEIEAQNGALIPASRANQIKRSLYDEAQKAYGTQASAGMEGIKSMARGIKESLEDVPGVSQLNKDLSFYGRQRDSMLDKMTRDERNNVLGLTDALLAGPGMLAGGPLGAVGTIAAKKALGSTPVKTGTANILSKLGQFGEKAPPLLGETAAQTVGQSAARGFPLPGVTEAQAAETNQPSGDLISLAADQSEGGGNIGGNIGMGERPQNLRQMIGLLILERALKTGKTADIKAGLDLFSPETKYSANQEKGFGKAADAESIAKQIEQGYNSIGPTGRISGLLQKGTSIAGLNPKVTAYEALRVASIGPLARAISGEVGVMTDKDIARAEGLLPKVTDTPAEARLKLKQLNLAIQARRENVRNLPRGSEPGMAFPLPQGGL